MNPIIDYVKEVEKCPPMILGEYSITNLLHQLKGLEHGYYIVCKNKLPENPLDGFNEYISAIYSEERALNFCSILLENYKDEKTALEKFFQHFDDYIRIPAYKKNTLYRIFKKYSDSEITDISEFVGNLSYLCDCCYGFDGGHSEKELYALFLQYLDRNFDIKDVKNWHIELLEQLGNESQVFDKVFSILTEFLKNTVGEDHFEGR